MNRMVLLLSLGVFAASHGAAAEEPLSHLNGWWDTTASATCTAAAYQLQLAGDGKSFESVSPGGAHLGDGNARRSITYLIEKAGRNPAGKPFVRTRIPDEIRVDAAGNKVKWDLVFPTADELCWHRVDRDESSCVQPAKRCKKS